MEQKARELRNESEREAIIYGALILLVLGVSLVGAFVVARSMIRSLRRLQDTATKVAQDRLPELVKQLSESDPQDVDTSVESVGVHSRDEIGQVAAAFDDVHREAVRLAAEQALLRGNVNAMFTNLSRRSQGLIQRQLSLISELESREADPDQLSSLFKLDHLATRMRRNGENLLVLAGEEPGRRWTRPVPLVDVLRAAASEVEQYERIELSSVPTTEVAGRVVNDLVHLLAELLENATSFSSPQTKVKVTGHALPDGRVLIEIHDTGIGLSPEDLAAINERLASPPTVDVSVSRRMGLFVVGRLSQRHGIRIQLRPSDSGGTTALVMLPVDVAQGGKKPPAQARSGRRRSAAARPPRRPPPVWPRPVAATAQGGGALGAVRPPVGSGGALGAGAARGGRSVPVRARAPRCPVPVARWRSSRCAPGGPRGPQVPAGRRRAVRLRGAGAGFGGQAPGAPQGLQAAGHGSRTAFGGGRRTPSAATAAAPCPRSASTSTAGTSRRVAGGPSAAAAAARWSAGRAARAATRSRVCPAGATRTRSRRCRVPRSTPRAATTSRTRRRPPGCRGSTTGRARARRRRCRRSRAATHRTAPVRARLRAEHRPVRRGRSNGPQDTGQFAAPDGCRGTGTSARQDVGASASGAGRSRGTAASRPARTTSARRTARRSNPQPGHRPVREPGRRTTAAPRASSRRPGYDGSSTGQHTLPGRQTPRHRAVRAPAGERHAGRPTSAPRVRRSRRVRSSGPPARSPRRCRPRRSRRRPYAAVRHAGDQLVPRQQHGAAAGQQANGSAPAPRPRSVQRAGPRRPSASRRRAPGAASPNDDLVRQAERVRQPAAGGVTTSGLPRRVPRANLVPGTAQQQQHQTGPQVSRAPDDVRGRLTNLRRGIAAGSPGRYAARPAASRAPLTSRSVS